MSRNRQRKIWFYVPTYHYSLLRILHLSVLSMGLLSQFIATSTNEKNESKTEIACTSSVFSISCNGGTINIVEAFYGRLDNVTCVKKDINVTDWKTNCSSPNATNIMKEKCNNQTICTLNLEKNKTFYNSLFRNLCPNTPKYLSATYTCLPESVQTSIMPTLECQCSAETKRGVMWPRTKCNNTATQTCPNNNDQGHAYRSCSKHEWRQPNFVKCVRKEIVNLKSETDEFKRNFSIDSTKKVMSKVESLSKRNDLYSGDLYQLTKIMADLTEFSLNNTNVNYSISYSNADELTQLVLNSTSNLLNVNNETWMDLLPRKRSQAAGRLLDSLETSCKVLAKAVESPNSINKTVTGIELKIDVINVTQTGPFLFNTPDLRLDIS